MSKGIISNKPYILAFTIAIIIFYVYIAFKIVNYPHQRPVPFIIFLQPFIIFNVLYFVFILFSLSNKVFRKFIRTIFVFIIVTHIICYFLMKFFIVGRWAHEVVLKRPRLAQQDKKIAAVVSVVYSILCAGITNNFPQYR